MKTTTVSGWEISYQDSADFHHLKSEIFSQHVYYTEFDADTSSPVIIDAGAHIGMATLYFKKLYPTARITAIEPHPVNFGLLTHNLWQNRYDDVITINAALADHRGQITLHADATNEWLSTASLTKGGWSQTEQTSELVVPSITLAELITDTVDLLKMDIEGAELMVLKNSLAHLSLVRQIIIETHQNHQEITRLLNDSGFKFKNFTPGKMGLRILHFTK